MLLLEPGVIFRRMEELAIASNRIIVENTLLAAVIVGCIYLERQKGHGRKKTEIL
jgi:hypothetical protein